MAILEDSVRESLKHMLFDEIKDKILETVVVAIPRPLHVICLETRYNFNELQRIHLVGSPEEIEEVNRALTESSKRLGEEIDSELMSQVFRR